MSAAARRYRRISARHGVTVADAYAAGYRIARVRLPVSGHRRRSWVLVTPEAGLLPCPTLRVAWRTLHRLLTRED